MPTCTVNTTPLHFRVQSVSAPHANGGVWGWGCKHQFAYPPPPLPAGPPPLCLPSVPTGAPPACHVCRTLPLHNQGTLGGARKVCPPFPLVTTPTHAHRQRAWDPPHPFVPHCPLPPAPVYAQMGAPRLHPTVYGDVLPTPLPPFPPLMCEGRGGHTWCALRKCGQPQTPHPTPFSPFMGEQGGMEGLGLATCPCAPPLPLQMGSPADDRDCTHTHAPPPFGAPHPLPHLLAPPTLPWGGREGVHVNRGRGRGMQSGGRMRTPPFHRGVGGTHPVCEREGGVHTNGRGERTNRRGGTQTGGGGTRTQMGRGGAHVNGRGGVHANGRMGRGVHTAGRLRTQTGEGGGDASPSHSCACTSCM
jgi:hypothetical protein